MYLLMIGNNECYIASIKKELGKSFEMTDLGYVYYYLGSEVTPTSKVHISFSKEIHWIFVEQVWHDKVQSSYYSNGTKLKAHIY